MKYLKTFENYSINEIFGLSEKEKIAKIDKYLVDSEFFANRRMNQQLGEKQIKKIIDTYPELFQDYKEGEDISNYIPKPELLNKYEDKDWYEIAIQTIKEREKQLKYSKEKEEREKKETEKEKERKEKEWEEKSQRNNSRGNYMLHGDMDPSVTSNY